MKKFQATIIFILLAGLVLMAWLVGQQTPGRQAEPLVFRSQIVVDNQFMGMEAFRMLVPKDWKFEGGVIWNFNKYPPDMFSSYTVSSPDGNSVMQQFPHLNMFWAQDQMLQSQYLQQGFNILQPMGAVDFLQRVFIPQVRQGVSDLKFLESQELPQLAQQTLAVSNLTMNIFGQISPFQFPYENRADAGRVKVEYLQAGRKIIEDFTASISYMIVNMPTMTGMYIQTVTWGPSVFSFRAPAEEMPEKIQLFQISMYSRFDNPAFNVSYIRLCAVITRENLRQQQAIFARYQQIRQTLQETSDIIWQTYQNRSASQDRIFERYSEALRGVDTYIDPVNNWNVQLPTGYNNAWTNGTDYVFSDSPSFNPGAVFGGSWQQMNRKR